MEVVGNVRYTRGRRIGKGCNGTVYEALDLNTGRPVAVKEIARATLDEMGCKNYYAEAIAMSASGGKTPNVVPIHFCCDCHAEQSIGIVMPLYRCGSLQDKIEHGPLSLEEVVRIGLGICSGLSQIHLAGYTHFDIKPSNVLFSDSNIPLLADFGQAQILRNGTASFEALYPDGVPPEASRVAGIGTVESDIWFAGLTLYRTVNGNPFYLGERPTDSSELINCIGNGTFPGKEAYLPHIPNSLRAIIRKATAVKQEDRYPSAIAFQNALAGVAVDLNWVVLTGGDGSMTWEVRREGKTDLIVCLRRSDTRWGFELFTRSGNNIRVKDKSKWQSGLTQNQAMKELKQVFRFLAKARSDSPRASGLAGHVPPLPS